VEVLKACRLSPGQGLPYDRHWALARPDGDALTTPGWLPKSHFLVLAKDHDLALVKSRLDEATGRFHLEAPGDLHAEGLMNTNEGRSAIAGAIAQPLGLDEHATPTLVEAQDIGYFDTTKGPVSFLNMNSLRALEAVVGEKIDPVRFRMNLMVEDLDAWAETLWPGKRVTIGDCVLGISEDTGRCKATHVNPQTGSIDVKVMHALKEHFGHTNMGVYGIVEEGGPIHAGDPVQLLD